MDSPVRDSLRSLLPSVLARELGERSPQFGKTVFMKQAYLLQEVYKVPLGYRFTLYAYGPYSPEVLADLDRAKFRGLVDIDYVENDGVFRIKLGPGAVETGEVNEVSARYQCEIKRLVETFGSFPAKDLELRTSITYVWNMVQASDKGDDSEVAKLVHELKPHFSESDIQTVIDELKENGTIGFPLKSGT